MKVRSPEDVLKMTEEKLTKQVSSVNYYKMKAKHIRESAKELVDLANEKGIKNASKKTKDALIKELEEDNE